MSGNEITLEDFNIRYANLRRNFPALRNCSVEGCTNPQDLTTLEGLSTTCAYHRLLFDFWSMEVLTHEELKRYFKNKEERRKAFREWMGKIGKERCDNIAIRMAQDPINWAC
jgi:hypothetical protein